MDDGMGWDGLVGCVVILNRFKLRFCVYFTISHFHFHAQPLLVLVPRCAVL
ncbi:uncharacterized protein MELLADRAFT_84687 [Melampsora larici-populina 98AG31]|uniref:Uncharacterized protein n=1 Tax=Melampsora larici-populina (strain 98AG31 / pathotype 3-4-7) TaxID=747676 RepID=F4RGH2_MELLP|nr:uncharacterized protein MELLADRAFT_84687 [Melampsora larici-populina 98AG31]EGG08649.1 hypothetical protein MELLADRAFT_84687 [Melampsora larici-populina 98AG31]